MRTIRTYCTIKVPAHVWFPSYELPLTRALRLVLQGETCSSCCKATIIIGQFCTIEMFSHPFISVFRVFFSFCVYILLTKNKNQETNCKTNVNEKLLFTKRSEMQTNFLDCRGVLRNIPFNDIIAVGLKGHLSFDYIATCYTFHINKGSSMFSVLWSIPQGLFPPFHDLIS